jgi:hypothetical protein
VNLIWLGSCLRVIHADNRCTFCASTALRVRIMRTHGSVSMGGRE